MRVPAEDRAPEAPVIFLHGGPGVPDMRGDSEYFERISRDGFDVYVYDMVGRGRSSRLADPRGYTLERDVADLEAIHWEIGAEKVVLIGHSYGAVLAAAYAASHPERVEKMVLSSPGDPSPSAGGASMLFRLSMQEKLGVYRLLLPPRPMLGYALLQVNPEAAHVFATDAEMDARFDHVYNRTRPALHCQSNRPDQSCTASASTPTTTPSPRPALRTRSSGPPSPGKISPLLSSRDVATTCRGSPGRSTWGPCRAPGSSTWAAPGTTPTRTSRSATWPGCGRSCSADCCRSARTKVAVRPTATRGHHEHGRDQANNLCSRYCK